MLGLEYFRAIWCVAGVTVRNDSNRRAALHLRARELRSGEMIDIPAPHAARPIPFDNRTLLVTFDAASLLESVMALGWKAPPHIIDLFAEYRTLTNGLHDRSGLPTEGADLSVVAEQFGFTTDGLLSAESFHTATPPQAALHCERAVDVLTQLIAHVPETSLALRRGAYAAAMAAMQHRGIPMERGLIEDARELRGRLRGVAEREYGRLLNGDRLRESRLRAWATRHRYPWPRRRGKPVSVRGFFHWYRSVDEVAKLDRLQKILPTLGLLAQASVTTEGRSRCDIRPFAATTGRNQPSRKQYGWETLRPLISPPRGTALAIVDFAQQEIGIAAYLSGDAVLARHYEDGDAFINFGLEAGLADLTSTVARKEERKQIKKILAPMMYGAGPNRIAAAIDLSPESARHVLSVHRRLYHRFWEWRTDAIQVFSQGTPLTTVYGWERSAPRVLRANVEGLLRSAANFPVQAHGSEILWSACQQIHAQGIRLVGVLHDAVMVEAPAADLPETCNRVTAIMEDASREVLSAPLKTAVQIARYPKQFPFAEDFWDQARALIRPPVRAV